MTNMFRYNGRFDMRSKRFPKRKKALQQKNKFSDVNKTKYVVTFLSFLFIVLLLKLYRHREHSIAEESSAIYKPSPKQKPKLILIYNTLWGSKLWSGLETTEKWNNWGGHPCEIQNCRLTYNKKLLSQADAVLFHAFGGDMLSPRKLKKLQKQRNPNSYWIYFLHESPENARPSPYLYDGFFNWTMGYRRDADIYVPYNWEWGTWEPRSPRDPQIRARNYAEKKDKLVWAGISHCGCMREIYIKKLVEYLPVDIFGACAKRMTTKLPRECKRGTVECNKQLKRYKFYLAFENSFCEDYVSEKFTETILDGHTVPIVMGGANYKEMGLPDSFIDVNDFDTIEDFANYIKYLDGNDEAYNKYFDYQTKFTLGKPRAWSCKICEMLNDPDIRPKSYPRIGDWYSRRTNCGTRLERLRNIMHQSGVPHPYTDEYYKDEYDPS